MSHIEVSQSVSAVARDGRTDVEEEEELLDILDGCELYCFAPETAMVFENAIERLFYSDSFRIGNATLPRCRIRSKLRRLDGMILRDVESKLHANKDRNAVEQHCLHHGGAVQLHCRKRERSSDRPVPQHHLLNSLKEVMKS